MLFKPEGFTQPVDRLEELFFAKERGYPVEGTVSRVTWVDERPVWELDLDGATGLVPASETGLDDVSLMPRYVGQKVNVIVKGIDRQAGIVACSRREAVANALEKFFDEVKEGMVIPAAIKAVLPRDEVSGLPERLVVDVGGGVLAEVPRRDATLSRVARLSELYPPGKPVAVKVIQADRQTGKIRVSLVPEADPWEGFDAKRGDFLAGKVVRQSGKIVFLEVRPGVTGIAQAPLRGVLRKGDTVPVMVTVFDRAAKKLHLKIRGGKLAR
ncbi:hypothetical RNA-binding protein [Pelotomaculum thermopropionicum SI]|uniref:Hypothetical RNA-binding protein n=1 Tax=Pelotomaculum thermopropionicum (strain DSM 13744 / JCM 10971 / SI) TaxID=370438 RepID=A5CZC9_PELTS|nr:hypothetical RNA-binding protein [Pelotomaculum thermopropionicum SI]